jgi:hypothetical protein
MGTGAVDSLPETVIGSQVERYFWLLTELKEGNKWVNRL